ncbi:lipoyl synthase [Candidatus Poribacteria bacterium]|nr:lipoyl synthase [Candidatus Poribacteria bacterium]
MYTLSLIQGIDLTTSEPKQRLPKWLKVTWVGGENYLSMRKLLRTAELHTVCEEASCPNIGECWERKSATFMILGDVCTRACRYCDVTSGKPQALDLQEPLRLARTVRTLNLNYCVITSVNRDDLADGGAYIFAECIRQIHQKTPDCKVEILTPDFAGNLQSLHSVLDAHPAVFNHNIESVRSVFKKVRGKGDYDLSLSILQEAQQYAPHIPTKSGIMVGLGERISELHETLNDLRNVGVKLLTIGQYLRPSKQHILKMSDNLILRVT